MSSLSSHEILARLNELHPKKIDLSLARMEQILTELGHPERAVPPVIHLAGTNGKGSTGACLAAALQADGRRVHRYVSPHLVHFNERILLDGRPIGEDHLKDLLEEVERVNAGRSITFFEITTAMAFLAFARVPADALILEVGMGGRLDATNVVDRPAVSVITPVSLDHEVYLGDRIELIAREKAGILKSGVTCVVGPQEPEGLRAIEAQAASVGTPLVVHGRDWSFVQRQGNLHVRDSDLALELPPPALEGEHQYANAATAVIAARRLPVGLRPGDPAMRRGIAGAVWPGRWQKLTSGPLVAAVPTSWEVRLDGGHNPSAARAIALTLRASPPRPLHLIIGMLNTKDAAGFLEPLLPLAASCTMVPIPDEPLTRPPGELAEAAHALGYPAGTARGHVEAARRAAERFAHEPALVLVCGSLHLAGVILADHA
ncbi:MAG TPA: folylpolyglutamate synthase/dihydrofolate synthase family protein [Geminicoccus sp.]|uniref:bifunctional folylpolyglutamate synthase/dihydrofolate synthase n=1 Tax=Geminicoccus sp. TaxID=2024832 RepID=UPI002E36E535|nr:folylpolyglutamate synthase/dihydrofolate synthase family protein [Geminicoccus sp.]HEX2525661.1 folylpolyglutamate synthase/dihydrofolate synthase family protein [Geminicoccus sp.]